MWGERRRAAETVVLRGRETGRAADVAYVGRGGGGEKEMVGGVGRRGRCDIGRNFHRRPAAGLAAPDSQRWRVVVLLRSGNSRKKVSREPPVAPVW